MPKLFGKEPKVWMPWALGAGGIVLILLYIRSRSSGGGDISAPQPDNSFGAGAYAPSGPAYSTMPAPETGETALDRQLGELLVKEREASLANAQKMFDLQFGQAQALGNLYVGQAQEEAAQLTEARKHVKVECGKGESMYTDVNGNLACKSSGKKGVKSIGNTIGQGIQDTVGGFLGGFASAAPIAGQYYGRKVLIPKTKVGTSRINPKPAGSQYGGVSTSAYDPFPRGFFNQ